jgi:hypothetical protein
MKPDLYTKAVLTVIALVLLVIACKPYVNPVITAEAQGSFAGVQLSATWVPGVDGGILYTFFDPGTGEIWAYSARGDTTRFLRHDQVVKFGQPLR